MYESPTPIRSTIQGTPSSTHKRNQCIKRIFSPAIFDEENQQYYNNRSILGQHEPSAADSLTEQRLAKRNKVRTVIVTTTTPNKVVSMNPVLNQRLEQEIDLQQQSKSPTTASECGTEVSTSSVAARRDWLQNFGKKHESNPFRKTSSTIASAPQSRDDDETEDLLAVTHSSSNFSNTCIRKPPKTPVKYVSQPAVASNLVNRLVHAPSPTANHRTNTSANVLRRNSIASNASAVKNYNAPTLGSTPVKSHRSIPREQVQATNEGYASVAELSQWLASDPTSSRKKKHVRRGRNVILKSRHFEKDLGNVIIVENNISRGVVKDKQKWLQSAFKDDEDGASSVVSDARGSKSEIAGGTSSYTFNRFRKIDRATANSSGSDSRSEIITDDAASNLSVADKKDWLKKAFASGAKQPTSASPSPAKFGGKMAHTDVMHNRGMPRDEAASRAKMRFKERSAHKLLEKVGTPIEKDSNEPPAVAPTPCKSEEKEDTAANKPKHLGDDEKWAAAPCETNFQVAEAVNEDVTPFDFRAAREALVRRSKKNGHEVQVINKFYLRKKKYEQMEEDIRRKSSSRGLLKPSWDLADSSKGRLSQIYEKKFVADIVPKKSFEELP